MESNQRSHQPTTGAAAPSRPVATSTVVTDPAPVIRPPTNERSLSRDAFHMLASVPITTWSARVATPLLRIALAAVFVWFGALKLAGRSPVAGLLHDTFPWANPQLVVVGLGAVEVVLGLALVVFGRGVIIPLAMVMHLCGTFITFLMVPGRMFQHGNPLLLTADAEFVVKNLVLIAAVVALIGIRTRSTSRYE
jgi:putative oxidoreductase